MEFDPSGLFSNMFQSLIREHGKDYGDPIQTPFSQCKMQRA